MDNNFMFFDIDGTLIDPKTGHVPRSASLAIRKAQENHNLVFLCTGRPYYALTENYGFTPDGTIFASGGGFELDGKIVLKRVFDPDLAKMIQTKATECRVGFNVLCFKAAYSDPRWYDMVISRLNAMPVIIANRLLVHPFYALGNIPLAKYAGDDIYKFSVQYFEDSDRTAFEEAIKPYTTYVPVNSMAGNTPDGAEISPIDVNKGTGILMVVTHYHGQMENTYGFGDSMNDLAMIQECRHGIVLGNGQQALKEYADYVTSNVDEDGIANALKHYGLI